MRIKRTLEDLGIFKFESFIISLNKLLWEELNLRIELYEYNLKREKMEIKSHSLSTEEIYKLFFCIEIQISNFLGADIFIIDNIDKSIPEDMLENYYKFIYKIFKGNQLIICTLNSKIKKFSFFRKGITLL